jgi:hypothetical protein
MIRTTMTVVTDDVVGSSNSAADYDSGYSAKCIWCPAAMKSYDSAYSADNNGYSANGSSNNSYKRRLRGTLQKTVKHTCSEIRL